MAERTLPNQLGGNEIIEAILDTLRQKMQRDCYFNPNSAYDWFRGKITVDIVLHDTGTNLTAEHMVTVGEQGGTVPDGADTVTDEIQLVQMAPNDVREATGQGIPVETKDSNGRSVEKKVKYARKGKYGVTAATSVLLAVLCAGATYAQANTSPAKPPVEQLSNTERIAIQAVGREQAEARNLANDALAKAKAVAADIAKNHPGYHYDNGTGGLVKDGAKPEKGASKREPGLPTTTGDGTMPQPAPEEPKQ